MTGYGRFIAALQPAPTKNVSLRVNQFRLFGDPQCALTLAKAAVKAKISNQRTLLMRSLRSRSLEDTTNGDASRGSDEPAARDMAELLTRLDRISDPAVLAGHGRPGRRLVLRPVRPHAQDPCPGRSFDFKTRNRRPPRDPVNALLSFGYALLLKDCFSALCTVGFDPYHGFFHVGRHGKPSLALDLMEEFRAVIADSVVLTLINNGILTPKDFLVWREACQLHGGRPQAILPGLRAAQGDRGDAPGLRLQDELRPDAGSPGPHARRLRPRRHPRLHRLHGAMKIIEECQE